jgi:RNA polymerase sigma factor (sigma-70 family)
VLSRAYVHWGRIRRTDRPEVYVRRMLVNANASWWRLRTNGEVAVSSLEGALGSAPARGDTAAESAERDEMWRLIQALPYRQRAVVVLRYYEDLDDATIADILGLAPTTVRTHAMRALSTLRERHPAPSRVGGG